MIWFHSSHVVRFVRLSCTVSTACAPAVGLVLATQASAGRRKVSVRLALLMRLALRFTFDCRTCDYAD